MSHEQSLPDRIALITGASRGIGRAVALAYAKEGAHVILIARTKGALEEVDDEIKALGGTATLIPMDLADGEKIDALGPTLLERWDHLDILVGNGGMLGPMMPLTHVSEKDWLQVMDVNITANWRLIRTFDPLLKKSDAGRAIFVTSNAPRATRAYWGPYSASKAALEALVKTYANEVETTDVRVNLVNPGRVATAMRAEAFPGEDPDTLAKPEALQDLFVLMALPDFDQNGKIIDFVR